jgi:hypothetical protein
MHNLSAQHNNPHTNPSDTYEQHQTLEQSTGSYTALSVFPETDEPFGD